MSIGLRTEPREAVFGEFVALFVDLAQRLTLSQLRRALDMWADQVDPVTSQVTTTTPTNAANYTSTTSATASNSMPSSAKNKACGSWPH